MKASELRLGNYITSDGDVFKVDSISDDIVHAGALGIYKISFDDGDEYGIPLTEEWLTRFGIDWDIYWQGYTDGNWVLTNGNETGIWRIAYGKRRNDIIVWYLKYVHQLQNLYFALTGKELKLKQ